MNGFRAAEKHFLQSVTNESQNSVIDRSGSCAIVILIVGIFLFTTLLKN
jgi:hypothetical protein